jgi:hypothetical protein
MNLLEYLRRPKLASAPSSTGFPTGYEGNPGCPAINRDRAPTTFRLDFAGKEVLNFLEMAASSRMMATVRSVHRPHEDLR